MRNFQSETNKKLIDFKASIEKEYLEFFKSR